MTAMLDFAAAAEVAVSDQTGWKARTSGASADASNDMVHAQRRDDLLRRFVLALQEFASTAEAGNGMDPESYDLAREFLRCVPVHVSLPDIMVHPDGLVAFEWFEDSRRVLTLSFGRGRQLFYAALHGGARVHGVETLGEAIPATVAAWLHRIASEA